MRRETNELLNKIEKSESIHSFLSEHSDELLQESAGEYLNRKLGEKNMSVADVIRGSEHGDYIYKVFSGTRRASRDILISIGFEMSMDVTELQMLLRLAGTSRLDPRSRRDAVTLHALMKKRDINYLNELLYDMGEMVY